MARRTFWPVFAAVGIFTLQGGFSEEKKALPKSAPAFLQLPHVEQQDQQADRRSAILRLWQDGKKKDAFKQLNRWLDENKKSPAPSLLASQLYSEEKEFKKALAMANRVLKNWPEDADAYYWKAKAYEGLNKPVEAANEYQAALRARDEFPQAEEGLKRVQVLIGK